MAPTSQEGILKQFPGKWKLVGKTPVEGYLCQNSIFVDADPKYYTKTLQHYI